MLRRRHRLTVERLEQRRMLAGDPWFEDTGQDPGQTSMGVPLADLDGDGDLDAFVACYNGFPAPDPRCTGNTVWLNDGHGNFQEGWHGRTGSVASVALGDLDGDGDLDAFIGKGSVNGGGTDEVLLNDGQGNFENTEQRLGRGSSWDVALGDVDSDGDLDAFVAYASGGGAVPANRASIWLNDGHGNFTDSGQELGRGEGFAIALGDIDGDGDLDAYLGQGNQSRMDAVFTNDGHGNFTNTDQRLGHGWANDVELADLDSDGDLDAFVANGDQYGTRQPNDIWLNDGSGNFIRSDQEWVHSESRCLALVDIDGDGDLDAYVGNRGRDKLWLNDGFAHFTDSGQTLSRGVTTGAVSLGDINGDRDVDIVVGKLGAPNEIWRNVGPPAAVPGDANRDGIFNRFDIVDVLQAGKYKTGEAAGWGEGDWNGDELFNQFDIVVALKAAAFVPWDHPLTGSLRGELTWLVDWTKEVCPVTTVTDAVGTMSHLSEVNSHWTHCPPVTPEAEAYTNGHAVFAAANGDQLEVVYEDADGAPPFVLDIIGGSGPYADAVGKIYVDWIVEGEWGEDGLPIEPWDWWADLNGAISY